MREERLTPQEALRKYREEEKIQDRGRLKVFLGYAPGVGKTYTMLASANRMLKRGRDVVIGYFEPHSRKDTIEQLGDLPQIPTIEITHCGIRLHEMDTQAIIQRHPDTVLVDELAHTNAPGMKHKKRYEDVMELLEHGINVYATVNLQHLESMSDIVESITGIHVRETLPDWVLDEADEVVVVDIQPSSLINRLKRGAVYKTEKVPDALSNFFRLGNLNALRELALRKAADHVDVDLNEYKQLRHITGNWHTTERILVAITSEESSQYLIRVAARLDQRLKGEFYAVHVNCTHWLADKETPDSLAMLEKNFSLAKEFGAECVTLEGRSVSDTLLAFAREKQITKFIIGHTHRSRFVRLFRGSTINKFIDRSENIQVIVTPMSAY